MSNSNGDMTLQELQHYKPTAEEMSIIEKNGRRSLIDGVLTAVSAFAVASLVVPRVVPNRSKWMRVGNAAIGAVAGYYVFSRDILKGRQELMNLPNSPLGAYMRAHQTSPGHFSRDVVKPKLTGIEAESDKAENALDRKSISMGSEPQMSSEDIVVPQPTTAIPLKQSTSKLNSNNGVLSPPKDQPDAFLVKAPNESLETENFFNASDKASQKKKITWDDIREAHRIQNGQSRPAAHQTVAAPEETTMSSTSTTSGKEGTSRDYTAPVASMGNVSLNGFSSSFCQKDYLLTCQPYCFACCIPFS